VDDEVYFSGVDIDTEEVCTMITGKWKMPFLQNAVSPCFSGNTLDSKVRIVAFTFTIA